jgi:hypothetical protein
MKPVYRWIFIYFFILIAFFTWLSVTHAAVNTSYLPKDKVGNVIQGTAPDVFSSKMITTGSGTVDVSSDMTVRFKCNYPVSYSFGSGIPWPIDANTEEFILVPNGKNTLTIVAPTNPTTCYIQEGRR